MNTKVIRSLMNVVLTALVLSTVLTAPLLAQAATPGTGRDSAGAPLLNSVEIPAKSSQWYKFNYDYDNSDDTNEPSQAIVELHSPTIACLKFEVWSKGDLDFPRLDDNDKPQPTGYGMPLIIDREVDNDGEEITTTVDNLLHWAGGGKGSTTFYVIVKNTSEQSCTYRLKIFGPDVSF